MSERALLGSGASQFMCKARPSSDLRRLMSHLNICVLSVWENRQLVFYALDAITARDRNSQGMKSRSAPRFGDGL